MILTAAALTFLAACGEGPDGAFTTASSTSTTTSSTTSSTTPPVLRCAYYDIEGCAVFGLVLAEPRPTAAALAAVAGLPGVAIAVWRGDLVCVMEFNMGAPGPVPTVPSRFAYVDAEGIRERRLATSGSLAPPITGIHISESAWNHWEDQWAQAQQEGVLAEAVAVYLPRELVADGPPAGFRAIVRLPWRRTDTIDPSYAGELLLETEDFPAGYLSEPAALVCE
ncbi:MAG: hypothetical protein ABIJ48_00090 [Actinomycetota bacterium]